MTGTTRRWNPAPAPAPEPPAQAGPAMGNGPHGPGPELVGYARCSTRQQRDDSQVVALTEAGCARIFTDKGVSGKLHKRPELDACLAYLQPGDTLVITRLSRAMRSLRHLLDVVHSLGERGVNLRVLKQPIDTTTPTGRLLFNIIAAIDEFQRELIVEGTKEGLEVARSKGHKGGRRPGLTPEQTRQAKVMITEQGEEVTAVARMFGVSRTTVYRSLDRLEAQEAAKGGPPVPHNQHGKEEQ